MSVALVPKGTSG